MPWRHPLTGRSSETPEACAKCERAPPGPVTSSGLSVTLSHCGSLSSPACLRSPRPLPCGSPLSGTLRALHRPSDSSGLPSGGCPTWRPSPLLRGSLPPVVAVNLAEWSVPFGALWAPSLHLRTGRHAEARKMDPNPSQDFGTLEKKRDPNRTYLYPM